MRSAGLWMCAALAAAPGLAQAQVDVSVELERVMVLPIQPATADMEAETLKLDGILQGLIGNTYELVDVSETPDFTEQGYTSVTYLKSCPEGQYPGCGLVVAQRASDVNWAIGAVLEPVEGLDGGERQLTVHVIDVPGSREVMAFGVVVGGSTNDATVLAGVSGVFDSVVAGLVDQVDVRGDLDDPEAERAFEERRQRLIAASLAKLEAQLGEVIREQISVGRLEEPRMTRKDLAQYQDRDDRTPWERLNMTQAQFIRFENSGATLVDWRHRMRGRLLQVLVRANFGGGPGTWAVHHEGRWLKEFSTTSNTFQDVAIWQYQEGRRAGSIGFQGELGLGVLPWLEVSGLYGIRNSQYTWRFKQDNAGDAVAIEGPLVQTGSRTSEFGFRVLVAPLPTYPIRPTAHLGYIVWSGGSIQPEQEPLITLAGTKSNFFQIGPGVEASAGRYLNLFVRGHANMPVGGVWFAQRQEGQVERIENLEQPVGIYGGGFDVQAGFQVRIGLLPPPDGRMRAGGSMDDDEVLEEPDL